jgi:hypothetical protein
LEEGSQLVGRNVIGFTDSIGGEVFEGVNYSFCLIVELEKGSIFGVTKYPIVVGVLNPLQAGFEMGVIGILV